MGGSYSIRVQNLTKRYRMGRGNTSLRGLVSSLLHRDRDEYHWALKGIDFELQPGNSMGIIGPNGAGKTTVLKLLSRVTQPTAGAIEVNGRLSALIELGAGFHPDLTGRENVFLNGAILGMRRAQIQERFDEIVDFAGIGEYLDTPVKRYSSGMYARLGFAIAAHVDPEVLLVDEVLAVGDYAFKMKCYQRMEELRGRGTTLVFVSHNMDAIRRVCDRVIVLYQGKNLFDGNASEAIGAYSDLIRKNAKEEAARIPAEGGLSEQVMTFGAEIKEVKLTDPVGEGRTSFASGSSATVNMEVAFHEQVDEPVFGLAIWSAEGELLYNTTTNWKGVSTPRFNPGDRCEVDFHINVPLLEGSYIVSADIAAKELTHYYDRVERAQTLNVHGSNGEKGLVDMCAQILVRKI